VSIGILFSGGLIFIGSTVFIFIVLAIIYGFRRFRGFPWPF
jgi:hypothetical protein